MSAKLAAPTKRTDPFIMSGNLASPSPDTRRTRWSRRRRSRHKCRKSKAHRRTVFETAPSQVSAPEARQEERRCRWSRKTAKRKWAARTTVFARKYPTNPSRPKKVITCPRARHRSTMRFNKSPGGIAIYPLFPSSTDLAWATPPRSKISESDSVSDGWDQQHFSRGLFDTSDSNVTFALGAFHFAVWGGWVGW